MLQSSPTIDSLENNSVEVRKKVSKELEYTYINLFIEETKMIFEDPLFQRQVIKVSKSTPNLGFMLRDLGTFKRFASEKNLNVKS